METLTLEDIRKRVQDVEEVGQSDHTAFNMLRKTLADDILLRIAKGTLEGCTAQDAARAFYSATDWKRFDAFMSRRQKGVER